MLISRKTFKRRCQNSLIFWINPNKILFTKQGRFLITKALFNKMMLISGNLTVLEKAENIIVHDRFEPFNVPPYFLKSPAPITSEPKFRKVRNAIHNRDNISSSEWFKALMKNINEQSVATHKNLRMHSEKDVIHFFNSYFFEIVDSMDRDGYRLDKLDDLDDVTGVKIGANGELIKSSGGSHRLFISQILRLSSIPVFVNGIHQQLLTNLGIRFPHRNIHAITEEINRVMKTHT